MKPVYDLWLNRSISWIMDLVCEYKILQKEILSCVKAKARPEGTSHPKFINTHVSSSFEEGDLPIMMRITRSRRDFLPNSSHELYSIRTSTLIISYDCLLPLKMWIWLQRELNSWLKLKNLEVGNSILDAYSTIIAICYHLTTTLTVHIVPTPSLGKSMCGDFSKVKEKDTMVKLESKQTHFVMWN
jgi:hypothetical protein